MATTVFKANVTWQAALAIDQWITDKTPENSLLILADSKVRSFWISKTGQPIHGTFSIHLPSTIQAELVKKVMHYLTIEQHHPNSRDDLLFDILHHPVFGIDNDALAEWTVQFYRAKKVKSFRKFLLQNTQAGFDFSGEPIRHVVEVLVEMLGNKRPIDKPTIIQKIRALAIGEKSKIILDEMANDPGREEFGLNLNDAKGFHIVSDLDEADLRAHTLLCDPTSNLQSLPTGSNLTIIISEEQAQQLSLPAKTLQPRIKLFPESWLTEIMSKYTLSVSHLNTLLKCPLSFYYEVVLRSPVGKHPSMAFGSAVHYAMEKAFRKMLRHAEKAFPPQHEIAVLFEESMQYHRAFFKEDDFSEKLEYGKKVLQRHFEEFRETWSRIATIERRVKTEIEEVPVHGFIDKIEFDYYRAIIVDYKTGDPTKYPHRFLPPGHKEAPNDFIKEYGGNYWRQAIFYYLLVKHDNSNRWQPSKVVFEYLEPQDRTEKLVEIQPSREEQKAVRDQIQLAHEMIGEWAFDQGCGEANCKWCRLVAEHIQPQ